VPFFTLWDAVGIWFVGIYQIPAKVPSKYRHGMIPTDAALGKEKPAVAMDYAGFEGV
jgi:hypothetical protein